jgi:hypothetical protein
MEHVQWLDVFCARLGCNPGFTAALDAALASELRQLGLDPEIFLLAPPKDLRLSYAAGVGHVDAELVGPDQSVFPVTIAFACAHHPGERLEPRLAPQQCCTLRATWGDLPLKMLRHRYSGPVPAPVVLPHDLVGLVQWERFTWPDVPLTIAGQSGDEVAWVQEVKEHIDQTVRSWNAQFCSQAVDFVGPTRPVEDGRVEFFVHFGSAPKELLARVLRTVLDNVKGARGVTVGRVTASSRLSLRP